jgi:hypothetical protein
MATTSLLLPISSALKLEAPSAIAHRNLVETLSHKYKASACEQEEEKWTQWMNHDVFRSAIAFQWNSEQCQRTNKQNRRPGGTARSCVRSDGGKETAPHN